MYTEIDDTLGKWVGIHKKDKIPVLELKKSHIIRENCVCCKDLRVVPTSLVCVY